jgi:hypothetical protein
MENATHERVARDFMEQFAHNTGLSRSPCSPQRYLWTDAFAVCNFLQLYRHSGQEEYRQLALDLVEQVHEILGKHREDDPRSGWISGLEEDAGRLRPTLGGLRIGKSLGERDRNQPIDQRLEWDRDGQYYHYLTKWMHALCQASAVTGDPIFNQWACDLAKTTHRAFIHQPPAETVKRLYWKMSINLAYPLVPSMGQHDPLDGLVTYREVQRLSADRAATASPCDLTLEMADLAEICRLGTWRTDDLLGIGGLLFDACRILQMMADEADFDYHGLLSEVLQSSIAGLQSFSVYGSLKARSEERLAFRELGLAIGLHAIPKMFALLQESAEFEPREIVKDQVKRLMAAVPLAESIETFWLRPANRQSISWQAHENINTVMLATSLAPDGFLSW